MSEQKSRPTAAETLAANLAADEQPTVFTHHDGSDSDTELSTIDGFDDDNTNDQMAEVKNELLNEKENTDITDSDNKTKKESSEGPNYLSSLNLNNALLNNQNLLTPSSSSLSGNSSLLQAQSSLLLQQALHANLSSPGNGISPSSSKLGNLPSNLQAQISALQSSNGNTSNFNYSQSSYPSMQSQLAQAALALRSNPNAASNPLYNILNKGFPYPSSQLEFAQLEAERSHLKRKREEEERKRQEEEKPHVKKPLNAFMLYMKEQRQKVVQECTLKESAAINQILGRKWHSLSKEEQQKYYDKAREAREKHNALYPQWSARDNYGKKKKRKKEQRGVTDANQAKKCRAIYGLDAQHLWCAPCRRKKKCIRFMDDEDRLNMEQGYGHMGMMGMTGMNGMGAMNGLQGLHSIFPWKISSLTVTSMQLPSNSSNEPTNTPLLSQQQELLNNSSSSRPPLSDQTSLPTAVPTLLLPDHLSSLAITQPQLTQVTKLQSDNNNPQENLIQQPPTPV